jgi:hypothetical protein
MKQKMRSNPAGLAELDHWMAIYCNNKEKESIRKYHREGETSVRIRSCELPQMSKVSEEETVRREGAIGKL